MADPFDYLTALEFEVAKMYLRCIFVSLVSLLLISSAVFGHKGKHDTMKLPLYELEKEKGHATLKINEVAGNYLVSFISPLHNFTGEDKFNNTESKETREIIGKLRNPAYIFSTKVYQCSLANQPTVMRAKKLRTMKKEMSRKEVPIKEKDKYSEYFASITSQYKLICKKPIKFTDMKLRVFDLAPKLDKISIQFNTRAEGEKIYSPTREQHKTKEVEKVKNNSKGAQSAKEDKKPAPSLKEKSKSHK